MAIEPDRLDASGMENHGDQRDRRKQQNNERATRGNRPEFLLNAVEKIRE
jgi:hypothetical protein